MVDKKFCDFCGEEIIPYGNDLPEDDIRFDSKIRPGNGGEVRLSIKVCATKESFGSYRKKDICKKCLKDSCKADVIPMKQLWIIITIFIAMILTVGCTSSINSNDRNNVGNTEIIKPIDYGNGVLYFSCTESCFANSLSDYLKSNPSMEIITISGDGTGYHGYDVGYYVIVKKG